MLAEYVQRIEVTTKKLHATRDPVRTLANSSVYLEAFGHVVMAWIWLQQSLAASRHGTGGDSDFYAGKRQACKYFFLWELPKVGPMLDLLDSIDSTTIEMRDAWF